MHQDGGLEILDPTFSCPANSPFSLPASCLSTYFTKVMEE